MSKLTAPKADETAIAQSPESNLSTTTLNTSVLTASPQKFLFEKFENLKVLNAKKAFYDEFIGKLENIIKFREQHDGSGLELSIVNQSSQDHVYFSNQNLIISFLDEAIKQGQQIKEKLEVDILNLEI